MENLDYGNIKEGNKIHLEITTIHMLSVLINSVIYKYYTHDNIGHKYILYIIMVMPCI